MISDALTIEAFDPRDIEIEAINAHHVGGGLFSATFELSDEFDEIARSYLLVVNVANGLDFQIIQQVDESIRSHLSFQKNHILFSSWAGFCTKSMME